MTVLLDTSVLIGLEAGRLPPGAVPGLAALSVVTLEELYLGVLQAEREAAALRRRTWSEARTGFDLLPVDAEVATTSAQIRADGRGRGRRYGLADSLIAATARVHGMAVYTQDEGMVGMVGVDVRVV